MSAVDTADASVTLNNESIPGGLDRDTTHATKPEKDPDHKDENGDDAEKKKKKKKPSSKSKTAVDTDDLSIPGIANFQSNDPFAEADEMNNQEKDVGGAPVIHIRLQQRNGRKTLTTLQGLPKQLNYKEFLKIFKKKFACNGTLIDDPNLGTVIQLQGDQRKNLNEYLLEGPCKNERIQVHGA